MKIEATAFEGLRLITLPKSEDLRGGFVKMFHLPSLLEVGIDFHVHESYCSFSKKDVIRGLHFQESPHAHAKIVCCPVGEIMDVVVDLRQASRHYGEHLKFTLSAENHQALYLPIGFAHGFRAMSENAMTCYYQSTAYSPEHDAGIRYDSAGIDWELPQPILSERDLGFEGLGDFVSGF